MDSQEDKWTLTIVTQERGTKKDVSSSLTFDSRESAVDAEKELVTQAGRGGNLPITVESENGDRLTILAMDFRRATISKLWSGIG